MAVQMQAVVMTDSARLCTVAAPVHPKDYHIIMKVAYSGMCGTDIEITSKAFTVMDGVVPGHEFTGVVSAIGQHVQGFKLGDRVACMPSMRFCGTCKFCQQGSELYCFTQGMRSTVGFFMHGGWAEYCELHETQVITLPDGLPLDTAVLLEPYGCIVNCLRRLGDIRLDADILIMGAGIIGILFCAILHHRNYKSVTVTEPLVSKRQTFNKLQLGYSVHDPEEIDPLLAQIEDDAMKGYDVIINCAGSSKAVVKCVDWLRPASRLGLFGVIPVTAEVNLKLGRLFHREVNIISTYGNTKGFQDCLKVVEEMAGKYLDFGALNIKRYQLREFEKAQADMKQGLISKAVFEMDDTTM